MTTNPTISPEALAMAERDLPCRLECHDTTEGFTHIDCCAGYRPAVAAQYQNLIDQIAAKDVEIARLRNILLRSSWGLRSVRQI